MQPIFSPFLKLRYFSLNCLCSLPIYIYIYTNMHTLLFPPLYKQVPTLNFNFAFSSSTVTSLIQTKSVMNLMIFSSSIAFTLVSQGFNFRANVTLFVYAYIYKHITSPSYIALFRTASPSISHSILYYSFSLNHSSPLSLSVEFFISSQSFKIDVYVFYECYVYRLIYVVFRLCSSLSESLSTQIEIFQVYCLAHFPAIDFMPLLRLYLHI